MKKLFLQSGKLMIGEFPEEPFSYCGCEMCERHKQERFDESVESAKASAVEAVPDWRAVKFDAENQIWWLLDPTQGIYDEMKEGQLYDIPSGWKVDYEDVPLKLYKQNVVEKIARLVPSENAQGETGIVAAGIPEPIPEKGCYYVPVPSEKDVERSFSVDRYESVSLPSQAERDSQEELWKEAINLYSKRDHSAVTSTDIEESMEQSRDVRIRADSPRTYETGYLDGYVDGVMVTQDLEPVSPPPQAEREIDAWKELYFDFNDGEGWILFMERMEKRFTLTRKTKP